jgi:hypothetical protein
LSSSLALNVADAEVECATRRHAAGAAGTYDRSIAVSDIVATNCAAAYHNGAAFMA